MFFNPCDNDCDISNMRSANEESENNENLDEYEMELPCVNCSFYRKYEQVNSMLRSPDPNIPPGPPPTNIPSPNMQQGQPYPHMQQGHQNFPGGPNVKAVDQGAIRMCRFRYTYIWQRNGKSYWAYLTFVGRNSIAGYRWIRNRWVYFGLDLRQIRSFYCV